MSDLADVFDAIYEGNVWEGTETRSGPGSGWAATRHLRLRLTALVTEFGIRSVIDVGCGEGSWMPRLPGYTGLDVSAEAIRRARLRRPSRHYEVSEYFGQPADLVIIRDVIQHLPVDDGVRLLRRVQTSGSRYLLASTYSPGWTLDIAPGEYHNPDLTAPPFGLPAPARIIPDGWDYEHPNVVRDRTKFLGLWPLR